MTNGNFVVVDYDDIRAETSKATLFIIDDEEVWLPKSQVESIEFVENRVWITEWIAKEKGLEYK